MKAALILLLICCPVAAQSRAPFSAQDTLQHAQVGTYSARLAPPVRVELEPVRRTRIRPSEFDREPTPYLSCRGNPAEPKTVICETRSRP